MTKKHLGPGDYIIDSAIPSALRFFVDTETQPRLQIETDGSLRLGPGVSTAPDTLLSRASAGVFDDINATDLQVGGVKTLLSEPISFSKGGVLTAPYTSPFRYYIDGDWTITKVRAGVGTAPTGATLNVDVLKNGTTIFTTQTRQPRIAISAFSALNTSTIEVPTLTTGDYLQIALDQVGSTIAGSDLTVAVWLART